MSFCKPGSPLAAVLAICALGAAAPAAAQQPSEIQSWSIPGWTFTPGVTIGPMFDSNVAIAGPDGNGNTASDTMLQMEPFGQLEFRSPRTTFSSAYRGTLHRYFDLSALNGTDHRAYVNWREQLTRRVLIFANDEFDQVATTDRLELNDLPFQRLGARHNTVGGGVEARLTRSLDLDVRYEPDTATRFASVFALSPANTYHWKATWGSEFRVTVQDGGSKGLMLYNVGVKSTKGVYAPNPMYAYLGAPTGRSGSESASIPGTIYRNVWLSNKPRPDSLGSALR